MNRERFEELKSGEWREAFSDSGCDDWRKQWFLDGQRADIRNTGDGMVFSAGPVARDHGSHAVLWTRPSFAGDVRIEFDYTRLDTICRYVNILYVQATGTGEGAFARDIADWAEERQIPYMRCYYDAMNLLHISYAAFGNQNDDDVDYVRVRRYPRRPEQDFRETEVSPDYGPTELFRPGVTYRFTVVKTDEELFFEVANPELRELFSWSLSEVGPLAEGRIGIRHMFTRCSRYRNIRIFSRP